MNTNVRVRLCVMMFLNFFIWGIWFVTMGTYLTKGPIGATDDNSGVAYGTQCLGAMVAPFIVGMIADRFIAAQRILGIIHILGAGLMFYLYNVASFGGFYSGLLSYMILFMPTLALVNTIALKQVTNAEKEFPLIRSFGTIGWIVAGLVITFSGIASEPATLKYTFLIAAICSIVLAGFSFILPNTPPPKAGKDVNVAEVLGLDALKVLKNKNYLVFFLASMLICVPLAFYYSQAYTFLDEAKMSGVASKMTLGQVSETIFLFLMPLFFARFGVKQMLLIGMCAWVVRYLLFAYGNMESTPWMLYLGIILHGICYDFFFVTGQIYTDKTAGEQVRASAQGLIALATYGVGMFFGFLIAGNIAGANVINGADGKIIGHTWQPVWLFPCLFAAGVALLFFLFFKNQKNLKLQ
jgi:nucleoside transporter